MTPDDNRAKVGLLVSVRSATEAIEAVFGGATVIDVKEPGRGPLGAADPEVWRSVRAVVPASIPVSVALGELREADINGPTFDPAMLDGIAYRKIGLAGTWGTDWVSGWSRLRDREDAGPAWVAVAYLDWQAASAPPPAEVRDVALDVPECAGLLLDTWDKTQPTSIDLDGADWFDRVRASGRFVAVAGGLDASSIRRLMPLRPDLFAVRGAACRDGDRVGTVDRGRVRALIDAVRSA